MARTRDAAVSTFYAAETRDCGCGCGGGCHSKFDGGKVYDAALGALRRRKRDADEHPGAHFVKAGVDFFHGDHPIVGDHATLHYHGPEMKLSEAGDVMKSLGYESSNDVSYHHANDVSKTVTLLSGDEGRTRDEEATSGAASSDVPMTGMSSGADKTDYSGYKGGGTYDPD